ncbi:MAG TPA: DUF6370 family protein [Chitinophagaceae bacterium]|nr:DUF6370 family protein [Chitinophagaceae bacterium]
MRQVAFLIFSVLLAAAASAQDNTTKKTAADTARKSQVVEASCGQCQFKMEGRGCTLAVRINGKAYFVDGTSIDDHGDAHADDGFCEAVRKAEVKGEVMNGRFRASYFKLLPAGNKPAPAKQRN